MIKSFDTTEGGSEGGSGNGWLAALAIGALALIGLYFYNKDKKKKEEDSAKQETQEGTK